MCRSERKNKWSAVARKYSLLCSLTEVQECMSLLNIYPKVAWEASNRARFAPGLDPLRFGVQMGEINLEQLLVLPLNERRDIVEQVAIINSYLSSDRRVPRGPCSLRYVQMLVGKSSQCTAAS